MEILSSSISEDNFFGFIQIRGKITLEKMAAEGL